MSQLKADTSMQSSKISTHNDNAMVDKVAQSGMEYIKKVRYSLCNYTFLKTVLDKSLNDIVYRETTKLVVHTQLDDLQGHVFSIKM